jgi:hypothetical protein
MSPIWVMEFEQALTKMATLITWGVPTLRDISDIIEDSESSADHVDQSTYDVAHQNVHAAGATHVCFSLL